MSVDNTLSANEANKNPYNHRTIRLPEQSNEFIFLIVMFLPLQGLTIKGNTSPMHSVTVKQ